MKNLIIFDIPSCRSGKKLRMRILRRFAKEEVMRLQDSVWDLSAKGNLLKKILDDFNELKDEIKRESKNEPRMFIIKGEIMEML
jgi:CRISPR-associated endonuclease Cas2